MKITKAIVAVTTILLIMSCGGGTSKQSASAEGFATIEKDIKNKFGDDAYFTDLTISYNKAIGNIIGVTVTEDPASLKMGQWSNTEGSWNQNSEISLEIPKGSEAKDFMFQLDDTISLRKLGELVEKSIQQLKDEKGLKNPTLSLAGLNFPDNGDIAKAKYMIQLKPENGGTSFSFFYKLDGAFIEMDY